MDSDQTVPLSEARQDPLEVEQSLFCPHHPAQVEHVALELGADVGGELQVGASQELSELVQGGRLRARCE